MLNVHQQTTIDLKIFSLLFSQNAMQIVGFMEDEVQSIFELVAAVLKLGNIEFKPESRVNGFDESRVKDKNGEFQALLESIAYPKAF